MATDRYAWAIETARAVRAGDFAHIDTETLAEELDQMGRSDKRELKNLVRRIIEHLIKLRYIGGPLDAPHWHAEIMGFEQEIEDLLEESPSLRGQLTPDLLQKSYRKALDRLIAEYGEERFQNAPDRSPFSLHEVLPRLTALLKKLVPIRAVDSPRKKSDR
jgi:Domain of unknown function DUF29